MGDFPIDVLKVGQNSSVREIAVRYRAGNQPGLVWLGGYRSDMVGTKAVALDEYANKNGISCCRHDYSGHGESNGEFRDGTISRWLEESLAVFKNFCKGPQILVGSSMGAWIALRMAQELTNGGYGSQLGGLLLLAPAPDFTEELMGPELDEDQKNDLENKGYMEELSEYSPEPNIFTKALFEDGRENLVMQGVMDIGCPVHIIQGMEDPDVPYRHALKLIEYLPNDSVTMTLVKDGDHRLSRDQDIELILDAVAYMSKNLTS